MEDSLSIDNLFSFIVEAYALKLEPLKQKCKKFWCANRLTIDAAQAATVPIEIVIDVFHSSS